MPEAVSTALAEALYLRMIRVLRRPWYMATIIATAISVPRTVESAIRPRAVPISPARSTGHRRLAHDQRREKLSLRGRRSRTRWCSWRSSIPTAPAVAPTMLRPGCPTTIITNSPPRNAPDNPIAPAVIRPPEPCGCPNHAATAASAPHKSQAATRAIHAQTPMNPEPVSMSRPVSFACPPLAIGVGTHLHRDQTCKGVKSTRGTAHPGKRQVRVRSGRGGWRSGSVPACSAAPVWRGCCFYGARRSSR
jgi:hypothetical protein